MTKPDLSAMTDEQLALLAGQDGDALEALLRRHLRTVKSCARAYFLVGAEESDLVQEGMIGLLSAIRSYEPSAQTPFEAYAILCIRRRMISAVRSANADKHAALNGALPLPEQGAEEQPGADPEAVYLGKERTNDLLAALEGELSAFERRVLPLYLEGWSGREIAQRLGRPARSADNAIQRIRAKAARLFARR